MAVKRSPYMLATGILLALLLFRAAPSFPLGLEKLGELTPSGTESGFLNPTGLWFDDLRGFLVVADTHARRLVVLNRQGQTLKLLGEKGDAGFPVAVAGDRKGTLYVAERGSEELRVFPSYHGAANDEPKALDLSPYRRSRPVQPVALFVDSRGDLYVADRGNRQVLVLDAAGTLKLTLPDVGEPADIWVDPAGKILVADPGFGGIRIYASSGGWQRTLGAGGGALREPMRVKAMVVDRLGRIWAIDEAGQRIKAFDPLGNLLADVYVGLASPADLAIDDQNSIYLLDQGQNRIAVFRVAGF